MIHQSQELFDIIFVKRTIRQLKLDPLPLEGFASMPHWLDQSRRWRRQVERFPWGYVVFISDRDENRHATFVIEGELDIHTGIVKKGGQKRSLPSWYGELAAFFVKPPNKIADIEVPPCLGYREPDHICDGGMNESGAIERPCPWRSRCISLQQHAATVGKAPALLLANVSPQGVVQLTTKLAKDYQRVAKSKAPTPLNPQAHRAFSGIWNRLGDLLHPRAFKPSRETANPGDFYAIDRTEQSGYLSIYYRPEKGRPVAVASVRIKSTEGVDLQLPLPAGHELLAPVREHVVAWRDRAFLSAIKRVPARVSFEQACQIICKAIESGAIAVPVIPSHEKKQTSTG